MEDESPYKRFRPDDREYDYDRGRDGMMGDHGRDRERDYPSRDPYPPYGYDDRAPPRRDGYPPPY